MNYNASHTFATTSEPVVTAAVVGFVFISLLIFSAISYAIGAFIMGRLFKKAGIPQWAAWVPIYNSWKLLEMGDQKGYWALFSLAPIFSSTPLFILTPLLYVVYLIFLVIAAFYIGKKLGKENWFVLFAVFLPVIWIIWLAFDNSKWPVAKKEKAVPVTVPPVKTAKKTTVKKKPTSNKKQA